MRSLSAPLLTLLAGAVATAISTSGWSQGKEYRYDWTSQVLSGIPELNSQYSGLRLVGKIIVHADSDSTLKLRVEGPKLRVYNDVLELDEDYLVVGSGSREEELSRDMGKWLETPFKVYHKEGLVEKMEFEKEEPEFIINIKKGLMSKLQLDFSKSKSDESLNQNQIQRGQYSLPVFKTMEGSVVGECETTYTVNKLPSHMSLEFEQREDKRDYYYHDEDEEDSFLEDDEERESDFEEDDASKVKKWKIIRERKRQQKKEREQKNRSNQKPYPRQGSDESDPCEGKDYYEVIKTKNFDFCTDRPSFTSGYGSWRKSDGSQSSSYPSHSHVTRAIICGSLDDYSIRKVTVENTVLASSLGRYESDEKLDITSYSILSLQSVKDISESMSTPSSSKSYSSLVFEYPHKTSDSSISLRQECRKHSGCQQADGSEAHAPIPDMESDPLIFYSRFTSESDLKGLVFESFKEMVDTADDMTESSVLKKDVCGMSVKTTRAIGQLSFESLKEVERRIESEFSGERKETVIRAFYDLVSLAGTNPAIRLLKTKVESGDMTEDTHAWAWILSNAFRNIKTPTEDLIRELVYIMKHENVHKCPILRAAVAMGVTEIVHKACVHPQSSYTEFPANIFGDFCDEDSDVIKKELLPYLTHMLSEASNNDVGSVITWVNALGNLGTEDASLELLKVVEGKITVHPHPRSVAIYKLIRAAELNPVIYRPVFMALIENSAENSEVRMAAVTGLTYSSPSTADLQRLAVRTWFEPSNQVSSYIYSTLKTLKNIPETFEEYTIMRLRAEQAFALCKPSDFGIQFSKNWQLSHFEESLKASVSHKYQWTSSEESAIPKLMYGKFKIDTMGSTIESLETAFYLQGAEDVIEKLYDLYSDISRNSDESKGREFLDQNQREIKEKMDKLNVEPRKTLSPEAHLTMKFMGMQKLYSFDAERVNEIVKYISSYFTGSKEKLRRGIEKEIIKVFDIAGADYAFPTESGIPAFITVRNPNIIHNKAEIKMTEDGSSSSVSSQPKVEISTSGVFNYKTQIHAGIMTPLTGKFHMAGVEFAMHISSPFETKLAYENGHILMKMSNFEDKEILKERPVFQYTVRPFTSEHDTSSLIPVSQESENKIIKSRDAKKEKKEVSLGDYLGLDMKVKYESERPVDLYQIMEDGRRYLPFAISTVPLPLTGSPKTTTLSFYLDSKSSETKEIEVFFSFGAAEKIDETLEPEVWIGAFEKDDEIRRICYAYTHSESEKAQCIQEQNQKWQGQQVDSEVEQECLQERKYFKEIRLQQEIHYKNLEAQETYKLNKDKEEYSHQKTQKKQWQQDYRSQSHDDESDDDASEDISSWGSKQYQPSQFKDYISQKQDELREERDDRYQKCRLERQVCHDEKKYCEKKYGRTTDNDEYMCDRMKERCLQRQYNGQVLREPLYKLGEGQALTMSAGVVFKSHKSEDRKITAQFTVGEKLQKASSEETQLNWRVKVETPELSKPFFYELRTNGKFKRPSSRWSIDEMLEEDLTSKFQVTGGYGYEGEDRKEIFANLVFFKSEEQKEKTRNSEEIEKCKKHESEGRILTEECKQARHEASSLDKVHAKMSLPSEFTRNRWTRLFFQGVKAYFLPYLNEKSIRRRERDATKDEYEVDAFVTDSGELGTVIVNGNGEEVSVRNVRLGSYIREILPICNKDTFVIQVLQKLTKHNAPASCVLESGKINTFDGVEYDYEVNENEHLVFADCSSRRRVMVTAKKTSSEQRILMIVDNHKYEMEIKKASRFSRDSQATIRVNGEEKRLHSYKESQEEYSRDYQNIQKERQRVQNDYKQLKQKYSTQPQMYAQEMYQQKMYRDQQQARQKLEIQKQQKLKISEGELNTYEDENTYVTRYEDGVYAIVSRKFGVSVYADGERIEVMTFKHLLKNKACGLCGDLNGEETADLKSPRQCVMSKPMLGAYTYVIEGDNKVPPMYQEQYRKESMDECVKKEDVFTKVSHIFRQYKEERSKPELRHLTEKRPGKICISLERVKTCSGSSPNEVENRLVRFTCMLERDAQVWVKRAEGGDQIYSELQGLPIHFTQVVYEPSQC